MKLKSLTALVCVSAAVAAIFSVASGIKPGNSGAIEVHGSYAFDAGDKVELAKFSDSIFLGRVLSSGSPYNRLDADLPSTIFQVQVLEVVKGSVRGVVTVSQPGGFSIQTQSFFVVNGDPLLSAGQEYLFATKFDEKNNWHTLVPRYGDLKINSTRQRSAVLGEFQSAVIDALR